MLESLIAQWGYLGVALGTFVEGEGVLLAAGALAHRGLLALPLVIACATLGSVAWAELWFLLGARLGQGLIARHPEWLARAAKVEHFVGRYGAAFVLTFRFVGGMGTAAPALLGASGYPFSRFVRFDLLGAALWAGALGAAGWGLGALIEPALERKGAYTYIGIALVVGVVTWLLFWTARRARRSPRSSVREHP